MSFKDNADKSRYELDEGFGIVFAEYREHHGMRALTHFETPEAARGKGAAGRLMQHILAEARAHDRPLKAFCAYAIDYFEKHPEARDVLHA
ncbi:MAG: GNAT family N-acetyltransferase [Hyphomonadaceae bacterium]|nr:GNAT family N-acetyltransferase [Hyphomonadaceae bacterium]